jgi:Asp-tRNA(Asn)/Glu-tRNA(Gln) amidotransferase A subunit family amidase
LKTTYGLIPVTGVFPIEPGHLDTIGPLGKDIARTVQGMELLQRGFAARYAAAMAAKPLARNIRIGRLALKGTDPQIDRAVDEALGKAGFQVIPLGLDFREKWVQAQKDGTTIAAAGAWISDGKYLYKSGVSIRTKLVLLRGEFSYLTSYKQAVARQEAWQQVLQELFKQVDLIAMPTMQTTPPAISPGSKVDFLEEQMLGLENTVAVNFAGNPALALPIPLHYAGFPVTSLQLIGPRCSEAEILNAGRLVEMAMKAGGRSTAPKARLN